MADTSLRQGQWCKFQLGQSVDVIRAGGVRVPTAVSDLPDMHSSGRVGIWYPAGKEMAAMGRLPVATVWPLDPVMGMPLVWRGSRLCFAADSVGSISDCVLADLPLERIRTMSEDSRAKFVEIDRG